MSKIDLYPQLDSSPSTAFVQTGTKLGQKGASDVYVAGGSVTGSFTFQGLSIEGRVTLVSLNDSTWTALPATALADRNSISFQNQSDNGNTILINYDNTAPSGSGIRIEDGGWRALAIRPGIVVYGRMKSGTGTCAVEELA